MSAGVDDKTVRLWDLSSNPPTQLQVFPPAQDTLLWATLSPDGYAMASVGRNALAQVHSTHDASLLHSLVGHEQTIYRAIFSPDGQQLATVSSDATLRLWDLHNGGELFSLRLPTTDTLLFPSGTSTSAAPLRDAGSPCRSPVASWRCMTLAASLIDLLRDTGSAMAVDEPACLVDPCALAIRNRAEDPGC